MGPTKIKFVRGCPSPGPAGCEGRNRSSFPTTRRCEGKPSIDRLSRGDKTAPDAARLFKIHPATVCRLLTRPADPLIRKTEGTRCWRIWPG
jgi:hypothetical protein